MTRKLRVAAVSPVAGHPDLRRLILVGDLVAGARANLSLDVSADEDVLRCIECDGRAVKSWLTTVQTIDDRGERFVSLYTWGVGGGRWLEVERDLLAMEMARFTKETP